MLYPSTFPFLQVITDDDAFLGLESGEHDPVAPGPDNYSSPAHAQYGSTGRSEPVNVLTDRSKVLVVPPTHTLPSESRMRARVCVTGAFCGHMRFSAN